MTATWRGRLRVPNHRGVAVPRSLGFVLMAGAAVGVVAAWPGEAPMRDDVITLAALAAVFAAGLVDDLVGSRARGLRGHVRELARGRPTTGIAKVVVIVGAAVAVVASGPSRPVGDQIATIVVLAASANVANGLDVRPGRALKVFVVPVAVFAAAGVPTSAPVLVGVAVAAAVVLLFDLRERAMLGDAGANVLGFAGGLMVVRTVDGVAEAVVAVVLVGLNLVAETVTFSRVIDAAPPLRWLDALGRTREEAGS
jgi:UDP-GlcNAc:undecaprenyl-phosphate/decaprenyl-phosphate GlcNAc-1-phosphate transferase